VSAVGPRIVNDASYVTTIHHENVFLAGAVFGDAVGG